MHAETLERRIERLETQNRRYKRIGLSAVLVLMVVAVGGQAVKQTPPTTTQPAAQRRVVRAEVFEVVDGESVAIMEDGGLRSHVNAVDAKTGESFTVMAPTMYEAAVGFAEQVGFDLEDG